MSGKLIGELKQTRPFESLEIEAVLNLVRTADLLTRGEAEILKPVDLSPTQYNVLRILRGAERNGEGALCCKDIAERMVTRDPDITRLLDRLEKRGLIRRLRDTEDRRIVRTRITDKGMQLTEMMAQPLCDDIQKRLSNMPPERLRLLIDLLEEARANL